MGQTLKAGKARSCGCLFKETRRVLGRNTTHNMSGTRIYGIWAGILRRCTNVNDDAYYRYGGRGITVCDRWRDFGAFFADMGDAPEGMEIDRVDVDGNYEPSNCRWATLVEQANNKRNNRVVHHQGRLITVAEYAKAVGLKYATAYYQKVIRGGAPDRVQALHTMAKLQMQSAAPTLEWDA